MDLEVETRARMGWNIGRGMARGGTCGRWSRVGLL